jgi:hypothetical protein
MNDRILELALQADLMRYKSDGINVKIEKFAYLVIQDCLLALEPNSMSPAIDYDVEEKFYRRSAKKIQQHFGVENENI